MTNSKIECALCGHKGHILLPHLKQKHDIVGAGVLKYMEEHNVAWASEYGYQVLYERRGDLRDKLPVKCRERTDVRIDKLFPEFCAEDETFEEEASIFATPAPLTPKRNPLYVFPEDQTLEFLTIIEKPTRNNIYIAGPSGTGKTQLVRNMAAVYGAELMECTADAHFTRQHFIGKVGAKNGETVFQYAIAPLAMKRGCWLLINELDKLDTFTFNTLKPMLEDDKRLTINEQDYYEVIEAHPDFRVIATNNTWARGDDTGMFVSSQTQDMADLRRFNAFIELDYLSREVEFEMLRRAFNDVPDEAINNFINVANSVREAFKRGSIGRTLSPAELVNWCENYELFDSAHHAARISFLNAYEPEVKVAVSEMISTVWGQEDMD